MKLVDKDSEENKELTLKDLIPDEAIEAIMKDELSQLVSKGLEDYVKAANKVMDGLHEIYVDKKKDD